MNFDRPEGQNSTTYEQAIADAARRMAARRERATQRRKDRHDGYWDDQTVEAPMPEGLRLCLIDGCGRRHKARGLCETHYKASRRLQGMSN